MFRRAVTSSRLLCLAPAALLASAVPLAHGHAAPGPSPAAEPPALSPATPHPAKPRSAQAVLLPDAAEKLRRAFPPLHARAVAHHMTIAIDPRDKKLAQLATSLGRPVDLSVVAVVSDDKCQAAVVRLERADEADDGGLPVPVENAVPHVTLSVAPGTQAVYSNALLARVLESGNGFKMNWQGTYADGTTVTVRVPSEPLVLSTTLCLSDLWNEEEATCGKRKECGFCRFMKLGPCGAEFQRWEDCIEACKEGSEDFIDKCASHTLLLKDCVDRHPEYYYSILEDDSGPAAGKSGAEDASPQAEAEDAQPAGPAAPVLPADDTVDEAVAEAVEDAAHQQDTRHATARAASRPQTGD
jgi:hypothetical protein